MGKVVQAAIAIRSFSLEHNNIVAGYFLIGIVVAFYTEFLLKWSGEENDNLFRLWVILGWPLFLRKLWRIHKRNR
jgi:hypothetical protein